MGVKLGPLIREYNIGAEIEYSHLEGKKIAIDALPTIYEMLTTIRDNRGGYLRDSKGQITSHLVGLFNRTSRMLALGIKPIYVFDGPPHPLKLKTLEIRQQRKDAAREKMQIALASGDIESVKKYSKQTVSISEEVLNSSIRLLELMGVPIIKAIHDGEAQAAYLVKKGESYCVASPDYDSFLYGAPKIVRNLKMSLQKKDKPIMYRLSDLLNALGLTLEMLVDMAILIGTDYNPNGVEGVGPKKAYDLIKKYKSLENILSRKLVRLKDDVDPIEIRKIFLEPEVTDNYNINFREPDYDGIIEFLVEEHDFNKDRVEKELNDVRRRLIREKKAGVQSSLDSFFS
ncbi:MAG: flap endonuclease-1 [Candidatus Njordarchaeia archaeon]